ncbi:hypothetical protein LWI29_008942 [Acer saccharum]|uniref:NB-ARC domain-containing protein n=1 Tax=Acer saccharum TaxID=4024 RepID=A0AA39T3I2_ACESA|nr:hypothetical protein LWI29_008942 [Acer saccharum]
MVEIAEKIVGCLPIARWFGYLWNYETNFKKLEGAVKKLEAKREAVESKLGGEEPLPDVKYWQDKVNKIIDEARKLINEDIPEQANTLCSMGFSSPNLWKRYQRGKNAAGMLDDVVELQREEDAWSLLKCKAGESIENPYLKSIATEVVEVCGGIPLAIVVIAEALKNKGPEDWKNALRELKQPFLVSFDQDLKSFEGDLAKVYKSIELSYQILKTELQQIFLLCSRMGRTHDASIRDLLRYGFGLGYFEKFNTTEEALCKVYALVNELKATSLLLGAPNSQEFSVHDVVCHTARIMASRENVFTVIDDVIPRFLKNEDTLSICTSLTLHNYGELAEDLPFNDSEDYDLEDRSDSSESLEMLKEDNELNKATQQLDDEADVQSSNKDCEGSSSRHLERGDPV